MLELQQSMHRKHARLALHRRLQRARDQTALACVPTNSAPLVNTDAPACVLIGASTCSIGRHVPPKAHSVLSMRDTVPSHTAIAMLSKRCTVPLLRLKLLLLLKNDGLNLQMRFYFLFF